MYAIYTLTLVALFHRWIFGLPGIIAYATESGYHKSVRFITEKTQLLLNRANTPKGRLTPLCAGR